MLCCNSLKFGPLHAVHHWVSELNQISKISEQIIQDMFTRQWRATVKKIYFAGFFFVCVQMTVQITLHARPLFSLIRIFVVHTETITLYFQKLVPWNMFLKVCFQKTVSCKRHPQIYFVNWSNWLTEKNLS